MDDAPLQTALGVHRFDGLHHAAQTVGAEQINIQNTPAFEVIQHIQPKFAALMLADPDAQDVFFAIHGDAQDHIGRLGHIAVILFHLVVGGVHEDEGIYAFQGTVLPGVDLWHDLLGNFAHQFRGDFHIVQALDLLGNIVLAHAAGVQGKNFVLHTLGIAVILTDDFRFIAALTVSGNLDVDLPKLRLDGLLGIAVAVVGGGVLRCCPLTALPAKLLIHLHLHDLLDDVPEHFLHGVHNVGGAGEVLALNILLQ